MTCRGANRVPMATNPFRQCWSRLRRVGGTVARALGRALAGAGPPARRRARKGLAPLLLLEDRRLPSATPFNPNLTTPGPEMPVNTTAAGSQQTFPQSRQAV